ncbi:MAG: hypothetical protein DI629_18190 [Mesorhizobium amorphae]|nr:MAG: hypothetical protein DI629_18190 [Mesorhizobium amorphae]
MGRAWVAGLALLVVLGGCRDTGSEGELFKISGKLVVFNYRLAVASYVVTLEPLQPMREGEAAVASFENPAGGPALAARQRIWPRLGKVTLESPPLRCVRKDRPYAVSIRIEDTEGVVRQEIATVLVSSEDQSRMPERPLVVGPAYESSDGLPAQPAEPPPPCPP